MKFEWFKSGLGLVLALLILDQVPAWGDGLYGGSASPFYCSYTEPTFYTGYFTQSHAPTLSLATNVGTGLRSLSHNFRVEGIWTEFVLPIKGGGRFGFVVGGGYLFSFPRESVSTYALTDSQAARSWHAGTQWYNLRGALTYDLLPSVTLLAGVRFENFGATATDPTYSVGQLGLPGDTASLDFAGYFPFMGALIRRSAVGGAAQVNVGVVGWPILWGAVRYAETVGNNIRIAGFPFPSILASNEFRSDSYFLETFADCSLPVRYFNLGAFFKLNIFSANTTVRVGDNLGSFISALNINYPKVDFQLHFEVYNWIVGGQVGIPF